MNTGPSLTNKLPRDILLESARIDPLQFNLNTKPTVQPRRKCSERQSCWVLGQVFEGFFAVLWVPVSGVSSVRKSMSFFLLDYDDYIDAGKIFMN